jgi:hypothetical protein
MKKTIILMTAFSLFFCLIVTELPAKPRKHSLPDNYLTFTFFVNPAGIGLKHHLGSHIYASGALDYRDSDSDLRLRTGAVYFFPKKILMFYLYTGGGIQLSRNDGYQYPYVTVGTNFLFLYTEMIHPLQNRMKPEYRFGFSFKF